MFRYECLSDSSDGEDREAISLRQNTSAGLRNVTLSSSPIKLKANGNILSTPSVTFSAIGRGDLTSRSCLRPSLTGITFSNAIHGNGG